MTSSCPPPSQLRFVCCTEFSGTVQPALPAARYDQVVQESSALLYLPAVQLRPYHLVSGLFPARSQRMLVVNMVRGDRDRVLTEDMKRVVREQRLGFVATVTGLSR